MPAHSPKKGAASVPSLILELRNEDPRVRERASRELYGLAPMAQMAIPALIDALHDPNPFVRQWVATTLERMALHFGPLLKKAVPGLTELLKDEDFKVREWAAHALGAIGAHAVSAIPALQEALEDNDSSVIEAATSALQAIEKSRCLL